MKLLAAIAAALLAGAAALTVYRRGPTAQPDVVIIILDDVATSDLAVIPTPNIDAVAAAGVSFGRAYSHAWCAPTRDSLLLGRWLGVKHGDACNLPTSESLDFSKVQTLAHLFQGAGYTTAHVGKWHLGPDTDALWEYTPEEAGFDSWTWTVPVGPECGVLAGGGGAVTVVNDGMVTSSAADDSISQRDAFLAWWQANEGSPRFVMVNLFAAHWPFKVPPGSILPSGYFPNPNTRRGRFESEVVGADTVIGQMMAVVPSDAWVFIVGDNGTPGRVNGSLTEDATRPDQSPDKVKLTCYEDGIRVPLIVRSPSLSGGLVSPDVVSLMDIHTTCAKLLGTMSGEGQSLTEPTRGYAFAWYGTSQRSAVISERWKLLVHDGVEALYDLQEDPTELSPLAPTGIWADKLRAWREPIMGK